MKKTYVLHNISQKDLNEITQNDYIDINGTIYMKKSKILNLMNEFIKHLERNNKIKIINGKI
jgi:hypothetical protein